MTWDIGYAFAYSLVAMGGANLFCAAPDGLQKTSLGMAILGFLLLYAYHCAEATGYVAHWEIKDIGYNFIVWAAILHISRILFIERLACKSSSERSLPSLG